MHRYKKYTKENGCKSMRLRGYDYSRAGLYFLTIVVQNRLHLFGSVENGNMILNHTVKMIEKWHFEIENKFPEKRCHEMIIMPNHFHCIIQIVEPDIMDMGQTNRDETYRDAHVGTSLRGRPDCQRGRPDAPTEKYGMHNTVYGATIAHAMNWVKTMTTNEYIRGVKQHNWQRFDKKLWQRTYYDHIIRNEQSFQKIADYIVYYLAKWDDDKFS